VDGHLFVSAEKKLMLLAAPRGVFLSPATNKWFCLFRGNKINPFWDSKFVGGLKILITVF
jgi:hypothetical protein